MAANALSPELRDMTTCSSARDQRLPVCTTRQARAHTLQSLRPDLIRDAPISIVRIVASIQSMLFIHSYQCGIRGVV
jgi:hypothetical protein